MSNKTQLQANNVSLEMTLGAVHGLPLVDDVKFGQYVWKKYDLVKKSENLNIIFQFKDIGSVDIVVTVYQKINKNNGVIVGDGDSNTFVVSQGDDRNITNEDYPYYIYEDAAYTDVYHSSSRVGGKKVLSIPGDFITTVVSDDRLKYPDNGVKNLYYYQRIEHISNDGMFFTYNDEKLERITVVMPNVPDSMFGLDQDVWHSKFNIDTVKHIEIITQKIGVQSFSYFFTTVKDVSLKIKATSIGRLAFENFSISNNSNNPKIWISNQCASIAYGYVDGSGDPGPFNNMNENTAFYCEALMRPGGWSGSWNKLSGTSSKYATVTWGVTESQFDAI